MASSATQSIYPVFAHQKTSLLLEILSNNSKPTAIFLRTREGVHTLNSELRNAGVDVDSVHPTKKESQREQALRDFKKGDLHILVTTDAYARSVKVEGASQIINFEMPELFEDYKNRLEMLDSKESHLITLATPQDEEAVTILETRLSTQIPKLQLDGFAYDDKDLVTKNRRNSAAPNRTKSRGARSKPLQNKKQKLRKGKKK